MASQPSQRVRRIPSPSTKQGPMKATKSFSLGLSGSRTGGGRKNSPSSSPTQQCGGDYHRKRRSPDHRQSPDRAMSPAFKDKSRSGVSPVPLIKRTGSLDTILVPYLKGEWPREPVAQYSISNSQPSIIISAGSSDKDTQTPKEWEELDRRRSGATLSASSAVSAHKRSLSVGNGGEGSKEKIKSRLSKSNLLRSKHSPRFRGSTEGINQELEKLSLRINSGNEDATNRAQDSTPDGHRAPVQELLDRHNNRTRSAITQTPSRSNKQQLHEEQAATADAAAEQEQLESNNNHTNNTSHIIPASSSSTSLDACDSCVTPLTPDLLTPTSPSRDCLCCSPSTPVSSSNSSSNSSSRASSSAAKEEKECESPDPKEFKFIREPPDGAEKVNLKVIEEDRRSDLVKELHQVPPVIMMRPRIPSTKSAFNPLLKLYKPTTTSPSPASAFVAFTKSSSTTTGTPRTPSPSPQHTGGGGGLEGH